MTELTGKQRRYLRSLGNRLKATVHIGKEGISDALLASLETEFTHRELVKLHVNPNCELTPKAVAQELPGVADAHWVQTIGRSVVLYRPLEEPEIVLPAAS